MPKPSELSEEVRFGLAEDGTHFWVQCPHMGLPHTLPGGPHGWTVANKDPLTVYPSIHATDCGCHGFITDGKWVQA